MMDFSVLKPISDSAMSFQTLKAALMCDLSSPTNRSHVQVSKTTFRSRVVRCKQASMSTSLPPLKQLTEREPEVVLKMAKAFAPATVANLGPGFDFLGCAVDDIGDFVCAELSEAVPPGKISIKMVTGDRGRLSHNPMWNCAGIAGKATMELLGIRSSGLSLSLYKGLPLGSGLGSSAASAAAAAVAVNALFGSPLTKAQLVHAGLKSETLVSGYHADNVAPSLMGGFVLIRSYNPLHLIPLNFPVNKELYFVLVTPDFEAPTKKMREVLPKNVLMQQHISNCSQGAALVTAIMEGNAVLFGNAMSSDSIVEPLRSPLIPAMAAVKRAAIQAGAYGCTISGAGPTAVAVTDSLEQGRVISESMKLAFLEGGSLQSSGSVHKLDREGAKVVESNEK